MHEFARDNAIERLLLTLQKNHKKLSMTARIFDMMQNHPQGKKHLKFLLKIKNSFRLIIELLALLHHVSTILLV